MQKACGHPPQADSHSLKAHDFRFCFTPRQGFFSPFPHGTGSLSVAGEYLALEGGPPRFRRGFTCPALLGIPGGRVRFSRTGLSPSAALLSRSFR